jgi:hypothetical protein
MEPPEPVLSPPGVASNQIASQQPVYRQPQTGEFFVQGSSAVLLLTPASHHSLAHARQLATEGKYQFAVVFAHAACELHTEGELIRLLAPRADRVLADLVMPAERVIKSLDNSDVREVYTALTGDNPTTATWWQRWQTSRKDRHAVAHKGAQMTQAQAMDAIDVADKYIKHVTQKVEDALEPQP